MDVDKGLLWSVLGVWGVVWVVTVVAVVLTIGVIVVHRLRRRVLSAVPDLPFYLDEPTAIGICVGGGFGEVVHRAVEERVVSNKDGTFGVDGRWFKFGGGSRRELERVVNFDARATGNEVIGIVLKALESQHSIVHVDLATQTIEADKAWRREKSLLLSEILQYVAVTGKFRVTAETGDETVLSAPVGAAGPARVRLVCDNRSLLRDKIPAGRFNAWCLGKCESWDEDTGEIVIRPVAVFQ